MKDTFKENATRRVSLWLWNEEPAYKYWLSRAEEHLDEIEEEDHADYDAPLNLRAAAINELEDEMRHDFVEYYDEELENEIEARLGSIKYELLQVALERVDYRELAGQFVDHAIENRNS